MWTDEDYAVQYLRGSSDAMSTLIDRLAGPVFGICFRILGHRHDAEDVTQEVLIRIFRSLKNWDNDRPLRPWVLMIAVNRCKTHQMKHRLTPEPIDLWEQTLADQPLLNADELRQEIDSTLQSMREEYRLVFELFHDQGMNYDQISEIVGRPVGTIKTWLHRARLELSHALQSRDLLPENYLKAVQVG